MSIRINQHYGQKHNSYVYNCISISSYGYMITGKFILLYICYDNKMIYYTKNPRCKEVKPSQKHRLMLIFVTGFMKTDHNVTRTEIQIIP